MLEHFLLAVPKLRGTLPVANLVGDYLSAHRGAPFVLGNWLTQLDTDTLEDVQTKLEMFLHNEGPEHAAEDIIVSVEMLSSAQAGDATALSDEQLRLGAVAWFEANLFEKLRRAGLVKLDRPLSVDPSDPLPVTFASALQTYCMSDARGTPLSPDRLSGPVTG